MNDAELPPLYIPQEGAEILAREILEAARWPDGKPCCPVCESRKPIYKQDRKGVGGYYLCPTLHSSDQSKKKQLGKPLVFTVRTRTIMERSHVPLDKWLYSLQVLARRSDLNPMTITELARRINVTRDGARTVFNRIDALRYETVPYEEQNIFLLALMARMTREQVFPPA
jgi:hypothetical protein